MSTGSDRPDVSPLLDALAPLLETLSGVDLSDAGAAAQLNRELPVESPALDAVKAAFKRGLDEGWLCGRENGGVRFSRVRKAPSADELSIEAVLMSTPGPGHTHPGGEVDLCFALDGEPTFDGNPPGWTVYPPGSWHVPTVAGGQMGILYFLPAGAIEFGDKPAAEG